MIVLDKYTIEKADDLQFVLTVKKDSKDKDGKDKVVDRFIGYYGYLSDSLSKIVNLELLNRCEDSNELMHARDILNAISSLEDTIKKEYHYRPKEAK